MDRAVGVSLRQWEVMNAAGEVLVNSGFGQEFQIVNRLSDRESDLRCVGDSAKRYRFTLAPGCLDQQVSILRFPHCELSDAIEDLPTISPEVANTLDSDRVIEFFGQVPEPYRAALTLFYLEDYSYREIAQILKVPLGTIRSRISRGLAQLQRSILRGTGTTPLRARSSMARSVSSICRATFS